MCKSFTNVFLSLDQKHTYTLPLLSLSHPCSYRLHRIELDSIADPEDRHRRLVELNVIEQCINLFKTGVVQRRRVQAYKEYLALRDSDEGQASTAEVAPYTMPRIHATVFDVKTGDLIRLDVSFFILGISIRVWFVQSIHFSLFLCLQVDFKEYMNELHDIYDLYTLEEDAVVAKMPHAPSAVHQVEEAVEKV
jgi:hypothetical protein